MKTKRGAKRSICSSFEEFLAEEGLLEGATERAIKRVLAWQIEKAMRRRWLTEMEMARRSISS
ncbi:MAG: hypothetical protein ACKVOI_07305 [Dongiaceae bacterium]